MIPHIKEIMDELELERHEEFLIENRFECELWGNFMIPEVGTLIDYTQEGMACGRVLRTVLLGRN